MLIARTKHFLSLLLLLALLLPAGCAKLGNGSTGQNGASAETPAAQKGPEPYYPTDFKDIMVPAELTWNREKSMSIRTASFAGGIINFSGRVDIDSLTNFFIVSMQKDGWKLSGSIKYKNVLLAFTKPRKTSLINIFQNDFGYKTEVNIYVTEEVHSSTSPTHSPATFR
ncbi:MAG: hypothetical protein P8Y63_09800 [Deltaproteobacteria bacterium]|jgi:hypothetical protein